MASFGECLTRCANSRKKVAVEAANLLYHGIQKEYKQAKLEAAKTLGFRALPTNLEVAEELDRIADEHEGLSRKERLVRMRKEALELMRVLENYGPLLVGSVWRGTCRYDSDLDMTVYHASPEQVSETLKKNHVKITYVERVLVTKKGERKGAFHIYAESPTHEKVDIKISGPEEASREEKCAIYGDRITGLTIQELLDLLEANPTKKFTPY